MNPDRLERLREMAAGDPSDPFPSYALAMEYASGEDLKLAIDTLNALIGRHPDYVPAYHQLGILEERSGRPAAARVAYTQGIQIARTRGDNHAAAEMQEALDALE